MALQHTGPSKFFNELAEIPTYTSAHLRSTDVQLTLSTRDHARNTKISLSSTVFLAPNTVTSPITQKADEISASLISPSGTLTAILREVKEESGKKRYVEIWNEQAIKVSREVTDAHGVFYSDAYLSSLSFSPSETSLLYTAEANPPSKTDPDPYARFRFVPEFGEGLTNKKKPTVFVFNWANEETSLSAVSLANPPNESIVFSQAVFGADETTVFATGRDASPDGRILGLKACYNRPANIWQIQLPSKLEPSKDTAVISCTGSNLTTTDTSARSPRYLDAKENTTASSRVVWLSHPVWGAHASCAALHSFDIATSTSKVLVDRVSEPGNDGFPGLYPDAALPAKPFLTLGKTPYITFHSTWGSRDTVLLVSLEDGKVTNLTPPDEDLWSYTVLGTNGQNRIICSRSNSVTPNQLVLFTVNENTSIADWTVLHTPTLSPELKKQLSTLRLDILPVPDRHPVEIVVIRAKENSKPQPTILIPHGGPHATVTTGLAPYIIALALEGYTIALPNYTGSVGYGEKYIDALIGKCGSLDVEDCVASAKFLIDLGISDAGKLFIQGGSHGGFLTGHLIGQYPDMFKAAALRNPVISCGEISTSDIPDWYYAEFGLEYGPTTLMTPASYQKLFEASPIRYVDAVKTPVLLMLGSVDQRVAPTQAIEYYHALKGRGREVEMLCFEKDSHSLDSVDAARVGFEAMRDWFAARK